MIPLLCLWVSLVRFGAPAPTPAVATPPEASEVQWINAPGPAAAMRLEPRLDPALDAGDLNGGLVTAGLSRLTFKPRGEFVVEVFVIARDPGRRSFLLEADREVVDSNLRLRSTGEAAPNAPAGFRTLVGLVRGPTELSIRSSADEYAIGAIRWRTREEYERDVIPRVVARARQIQADVSLVPGETERQRVLRQLWERASLARDREVAREAWLGMTRAFYWEAMRDPDPGHLGRLEELFMRAWRLGPNDDIVNMMITSACAGINLPPGSLPALDTVLCKDVKPVFWKTHAKEVTGAPAWADAQRRLRIRLEEIAAYWVEKRQRADGSLAGGWNGETAGTDAAMMKNWGALAAGLGSDVAARGMDRLAAGIQSSGLLENGYDKRAGPAPVSSRITSGALPYFALLHPETALAKIRETARCLPYWVRKQEDGSFRFTRESFNCREFEAESRYVDTWRNLEAVGPALWYAFLSRDEETISRLWYWGEAWTKLMRSTEGGKPVGVIPEEMASADGSYLVREGGWTGDDWSAEGQRGITWLFAALADLKDDKRWIAAIEDAQAAQPPMLPDAPPPTDDDLQSGTIAPVPPPAAAVSEKKADGAGARGLLQRLGGKRTMEGYFEYSSEWDNGDRLAKLALEFEKKLSTNLPMYTTEVLFSDRVFHELPTDYQRSLFGGAAPRPDRYPAFAVTWTPAREQFARAVVAATADSLRLKLYSFEAGPIRADLRAWRLRPGRYQWTIAETKEQGEIEIDAARRQISLPLQPGREFTIDIKRR